MAGRTVSLESSESDGDERRHLDSHAGGDGKSSSSKGASDAEDGSHSSWSSSFPSELGCPYQRICGPRTPESKRRHADAGERLVRLASKFHMQAESGGSTPSSPTRSGSPDLLLPRSDEPHGVSPSPDPSAYAPHLAADKEHADVPAAGSALSAGSLNGSVVAHSSRAGESALQTAGLAAAAAAEPLDSTDDTVIIFDWDDTLFPTWFVSEVVVPCLPPDSNSDSTLPEDSPFAEALTRHALTVRELLSAARGIGRVGIVTLAQRPWVLSSAHRFFPGEDFKQILKDFDIPIIYARECLRRPMISQAKVEEGVNIFTIAKQAAMLKALKKLYGKRPWTNVISIGDSIVERDAITELLWSHDQESDRTPCCKTVKLMEEPSVEQLGAELVLLGMWLRSMASHAEDFDVVMDDSEEMMVKMHARFSS